MRRYILILIFFVVCPIWLKAQLNTDRLTNIGRNALYFEDYVLSIQYFNQVIKVKPFLQDAYFYRAIAKIQLEDYVGARADLDRVIELNPFIPMAYYARGYSRRRLDDMKGACEDFTKSLEYSPENPLYLINRIEVYEQMEEYDKGLSDIDFLIRRSPKQSGLYLEKGKVLLSKGDTLAAKPYFYKGVEIDSLDAEMWGAKAYYDLIVDDNMGALKGYDRSVELGSKNVSTYINRGILNYYEKKYRTALEDYDMAVKIDPYSVQALYNRALLRSEVGDYNNALDDLDNILKLDPKFFEAVYHRAVIHIELGQWNDAVKELTKLIERYRYFTPALQLRANAYEKQGKDKLAFKDRKAAYDLEKEYRSGQRKDTLDTDVHIASHGAESVVDKSSMFLADVDSDTDGGKQKIRGAIQKNNVELTSEKNFQLSYYVFNAVDLPQNNRLDAEIIRLNASQRLGGPVYIVNKEVQMSGSMIDFHFAAISQKTSVLEEQPENASLYLSRAMDFTLVKDFTSAISDFSRAIFYGEDMAMAYFMRANVRYKSIEVNQNKMDIEESVRTTSKDAEDTKLKGAGLSLKPLYAESKDELEYEMVMRDYDKVIELAPQFPYAWFNKANLLSMQNDWNAALSHYNEAISINPDFGEAYFNRALVYLMLDKEDEAIADFSKAGEMGVYQSYNIISRLLKGSK